jgi:hypothetical protein
MGDGWAGEVRESCQEAMAMRSWLDLSQLLVNIAGIAILALTAWNLYFARKSFRQQMNVQIYLEFTKS